MKYPTIGHYLETLANPHKMFRTLDGLAVERNAYGEFGFVSGNYAAVFRAERNGRPVALKCYTRQVDHADEVYGYLKDIDSPYLIYCEYLPDEIYAYDESGNGRFFPVAVMPWIEGDSLDHLVAGACMEGDAGKLARLAGEFDRMALWLLSQEFAHGDLKPDNILVDERGRMKLIDYDGMFIPQLAGMPCSLVGSPAYRHPSRDARYFNEHIDDYSIAIISASLHALAENPSPYAIYNEGDNLVFNPAQIMAGESALLDELEKEWLDGGKLTLYALCRMLRKPSPELPRLEYALRMLCGIIDIPETCIVVDDTDSEAAIVHDGYFYGFADIFKGEMVTAPIFEDAKPFAGGVAPVKVDSYWRFIDMQGRKVLDCSRYDTVEPFREGYALVGRDGLYGFIDRAGEEVITPIYPFAQSFRNGRDRVRVGDEYEYIKYPERAAV